jgi:hypothetical protein
MLSLFSLLTWKWLGPASAEPVQMSLVDSTPAHARAQMHACSVLAHAPAGREGAGMPWRPGGLVAHRAWCPVHAWYLGGQIVAP